MMLKIAVDDPTAVQGEQLCEELRVGGLEVEVHLAEVMSDWERDEETGRLTREPIGWELQIIGADNTHRSIVQTAMKVHRPDRQFGWSAETKARAADEAKVKATLAKANPSNTELRDALAVFAKRQGLT